MDTEMQDAGFKDMGEYVLNMKNTVAQYITTRPIMDICEETVWMPGAWVAKRWWKQDVLNLEGERAAAAAAEGGEYRVEEDMER